MEFKEKIETVIRSIQWNQRLKKHEYAERRITFGKYAGRMIKDIPTGYIKWGIMNFKDDWAEMFAREIQRRNPSLKK